MLNKHEVGIWKAAPRQPQAVRMRWWPRSENPEDDGGIFRPNSRQVRSGQVTAEGSLICVEKKGLDVTEPSRLRSGWWLIGHLGVRLCADLVTADPKHQQPIKTKVGPLHCFLHPWIRTPPLRRTGDCCEAFLRLSEGARAEQAVLNSAGKKSDVTKCKRFALSATLPFPFLFHAECAAKAVDRLFP